VIEPSGVGSQQPLHALDQIGFGRFDHQMKMVGHQAPGVNLPVGFGAGFPQRFNKKFPVLYPAKDGFLVVAAVHEVIDGPLKLQP